LARTKAVQAFKDESLDLEARIIEAIQKVGPKNISLLSRMTGAHAETIRYKVKRQFKKLGFKIHADVDYAKLGLTEHWAELHFTKTYQGVADKVLASLNDVAYLTYYAKIVPQGYFVAIFSLPAGKSEEFEGFLEGLRRMGILGEFTLSRAVISRHDSMLPSYFNFQSGQWDIDWSRVKLGGGRPLPAKKQQTNPDIDSYDLLLMKELQIDALQHVAGTARKLKVHQKTLEYHYRAHVQRRKLIPAYYVRWMREHEKSPAHSVMLTRLVFRDLGDDFQRVQKTVSKIPFLWSEYLTEDGTYIALLSVPVKEAVTVFNYLSNEVPALYDRVDVSYINRDESMLFTVPYQMYDTGWAFDVQEMKSKFAKSIKKVEK
jgi:DNA-binding Lrp family transcriptional regulator